MAASSSGARMRLFTRSQDATAIYTTGNTRWNRIFFWRRGRAIRTIRLGREKAAPGRTAAGLLLCRMRFGFFGVKPAKAAHRKKKRGFSAAPSYALKENSNYTVGRRAMIFLATVGGKSVAILRIMARTRRLSPSERVLLYFLISARKRISS